MDTGVEENIQPSNICAEEGNIQIKVEDIDVEENFIDQNIVYDGKVFRVKNEDFGDCESEIANQDIKPQCNDITETDYVVKKEDIDEKHSERQPACRTVDFSSTCRVSRYNLSMDINELILKVQLNPPIWDKRIGEYANRNIVNACWKQISSEMKTEETTLRKKWKYLREQFSMECSKIKLPRSEDAAATSTEPKWPYFKSMLFLRDVIKPRALSSNLKKAFSSTANGEDELFEHNIRADNQDDDLTEAESNQPLHLSVCQVKKRKRVMFNSSFNEKILQLERQKIATLQSALRKEPEDDDMLFFKSLLPFVSKIPPEYKLRLRSRIQQVVDEFAYGGKYSQQTSPVLFTRNRPPPVSSSSSLNQEALPNVYGSNIDYINSINPNI